MDVTPHLSMQSCRSIC